MAMVQTKRLAALLLALLLTLFLLPSAWADSGVVGGTTVSGTVRVYLSSISSLTAVDVSIAGSYSVGGDASPRAGTGTEYPREQQRRHADDDRRRPDADDGQPL